VSWILEHVATLSTVDGAIELLMVFVVLVGVRSRVGRLGPLAWLVAVYFLFESAISFGRVLFEHDADLFRAYEMVLELVGTVVIVLMLARASHIGRALAFTVDEARYRAREYDRARRDYTQVVRHRIANPLTVIQGAAQTLDAAELDEATRHALRVSIIAAAQELEAISLEPTRGGVEERDLDAIAHVRAARDADPA
jgi:signal transduction histidine kinase